MHIFSYYGLSAQNTEYSREDIVVYFLAIAQKSPSFLRELRGSFLPVKTLFFGKTTIGFHLIHLLCMSVAMAGHKKIKLVTIYRTKR